MLVNTPFTKRLLPVCLPCATTKYSRSPLKAQKRPKGCFGRSRGAQRTFRPHLGRHGRREFLSMFKTVAQMWPRRSVAHRSFKGERRKAHASPWTQNGCTGAVIGRPLKSAHCCKHYVSIWALPLLPFYYHLSVCVCVCVCVCGGGGFILNISQGYFTDTGAIVWLSHCPWLNL